MVRIQLSGEPMNRRSLFKLGALFTGSQAVASFAAPTKSLAAHEPIVLYCDLAVDPAREQEMLDAFHKHFKPAAEKFNGYIDVKILKLRKVVQGGPQPASAINYRFQLTYESEEKRQLWIHSTVHQTVWPMVENTVTDKGYLTLLTDSR
jgi:antibiotic biosynthesis monooxygenase (ABM) superfamily enzyme